MQMSTLSKVNESGDSVHKLTTFEREGKKKKKCCTGKVQPHPLNFRVPSLWENLHNVQLLLTKWCQRMSQLQKSGESSAKGDRKGVKSSSKMRETAKSDNSLHIE